MHSSNAPQTHPAAPDGTVALKQIELELALTAADLSTDGFVPSVRAACTACGLTFLFDLPVPVDGEWQRVAAAGWHAPDGEPALCFVRLDRGGTRIVVTPDCPDIAHAGAVARAYFDLVAS